jgi:hypothetical protein
LPTLSIVQRLVLLEIFLRLGLGQLDPQVDVLRALERGQFGTMEVLRDFDELAGDGRVTEPDLTGDMRHSHTTRSLQPMQAGKKEKPPGLVTVRVSLPLHGDRTQKATDGLDRLHDVGDDLFVGLPQAR